MHSKSTGSIKLNNLIFILLLLTGLNISAASLKVNSFTEDPFDISARTYQRLDLNDLPCALVIVELPVDGCAFSGNIVGNTEMHTNQYWVYLTDGTKRFEIRCPGSPSLMVETTDENGIGVRSATTYRLSLTGYDTSGSHSSAPNGNYLVLNVSPKTPAFAKAGSKMITLNSGVGKTFLEFGTYVLTVEAEGYAPYSETIQIDDSGTKTIDVSLQSLLATLNITSVTPGTEIFINSEKKGTDRFSGSFPSGYYLIEGSRNGYKAFSQAVNLSDNEKTDIVIPALSPIYASLDIDYEPIGATVTVDGKTRGTTPLIVNDLLVGQHSVRISSNGFEPFETILTLQEGEPIHLAGALNENKISKWDLLKKYETAGFFHEGKSCVSLNGKFGYVDKEGKVIIPLKYDWADDFHDGYAQVKLKDKYGVIDKSDKKIIPIKYDDISDYSEGLFKVKLKNKFGFIDTSNKIVVPVKYDQASFFTNGMAYIKLGNKYGYVDAQGNLAVPIIYDEAFTFSDGLGIVKLNGKYGFVDKSGKIVIPIVYDDAGTFKNGKAQVKLNGEVFYIDKSGKRL